MLGFFAAFALVYLAGFWNIDTQQGLTQFTKGMAKFVIHFAFLVAAIGYLAQRGERFFWRALGWFTVGFVANAVYGILQLGSQLAGHSLDNLLLNPLTGGAASINIYGAIGGQNIYRVNALTGDPNHLGVMLIMPLLMLTPVYLRMPRGHRLRWPLAIALVFLLLVDIATFSRSGGVGLIAGALVLVLPYRRFFRSRQFLYPLGAVVVVLLGVLYDAQALLRDLPAPEGLDAGQLGERALRRLLVHRPGPAHASAARSRQQQLRRLLRVRDREGELRRPLVLGRRDRRVGAARPRPLDRLPPLRVRAAARRAAARPAARPDRRPGRPARAAARVRHDGGARRDDRRQLLLPHDPVLLLLRLPGLRARPARRVRRAGRAGSPSRRCASSSSRRRGRGRRASSRAASSPTPSSGCASAGWRSRCSRPVPATATTASRTAAGWRRTSAAGRGWRRCCSSRCGGRCGARRAARISSTRTGC